MRGREMRGPEFEKMKQHHFVITCFPGQGHVNPALQLANNLAALGAAVTFSSTADGLKRAPPAPAGITYASFSDEIMPMGPEFIAYMTNLSRVGSQTLTDLLRSSADAGRPVTCLVYSLLLPWAATVARDMHVPSAFLAIQCAAAFSIYTRFFSTATLAAPPPDSVTIRDLPAFSSSDFPTFVLPGNPMNSFMGPMMMEHMKQLETETETETKLLVLLNTFEELEHAAIEDLRSSLNVVAIGPLVTSSDGEGYSEWLDSKPERSVVYVAFGSLVVLSKEQKIEILHGLVQSKRPFLWVLRSYNGEEDEELKKVFEEEMNNISDIGIIVTWCSQMRVLSHKSVGCFVTHCGWSSTLEGLVCGVPLVGCPHFSDQTTNAKLVEEVWGNGVRGRIDGEVVIKREELGKCLDVVMGEGQRGEEIRNNASMWRGMAMDAVKDGGSSYNNLRKFMESFEGDRGLEA